MLTYENTLTGLQAFNMAVRQKAQANLAKWKQNASGELSDSIQGVVSVGPNSIGNAIYMLDYGKFQDQGVNGKKSAWTTPFKFKDKMPPSSAFDKWIVRRGIAPRSKNGQFQSRKSLAFAIARSVYIKGIKPTRFFTDAFEEAFTTLPDEIVKAYGLDLERFLEISLNNAARN